MLITFKCKATGDLQMFSEHAQEILAAAGKRLEPAAAPRGIITAAEAPAALARLRQAVESARTRQREHPSADDSPDAPGAITLAQRAFPFIAMLERAIRKDNDIVWGV